MLGQTPMMQQYQKIKNQYPDTILFYRLGDFYEMFGPDAELASRELEITLTGREAGMEQRVPMCGVPYHAAENYIARLIQKGYRVAVCEQVEDPRTVKGIVRREVIRVITPGTTLEPQLLQSSQSTILAAVYHHDHAWGLGACDVSTGEFMVSEFGGFDGLNILKDELFRLNPAEILLAPDSASYREIYDGLERTLITPYKKEAFNYNNARQTLLDHFQTQSLNPLGLQDSRQAVSCAGAILQYLKETQKLSPYQIKTISLYNPQAWMIIDAPSMRNLEITRTNRLNDRKGSLLDIMDNTRTAQGARLLRQWLERPLTNKEELQERLTAVEVLAHNWSQRQGLRGYLDEVYDLERLMTRVIYRRALPRELAALKKSLTVLAPIKDTLDSLEGSRCLALLHQGLDTLQDLLGLLEAAVVDDPPHQVKEGGIIRPGFNSGIDSLRDTSKNGKDWIARLESEEKDKTGIRSLKIGFNKVFGYYFEVTKANLLLVPEHFQRKQTLANGERYVTEELIRLESQVLGAEEKLLNLEEEVYQEILSRVAEGAARVQETARTLARLDVLQSMAELAVRGSYVRPEILEKQEDTLIFEALRHPVVEMLASHNSFLPNDLLMPPQVNMYIVTGPNMGGKSTYCRSAALATIMAQAGSFVPAKKAIISIRDRVFARVGASDDLGSGQSTFMVEMNEVANILRYATRYSLVILDEVGRGTSTYDGLSMAWAVSEYMVKALAAKTLFATHYHELTQLADSYEAIRNLSVSVKERGEEIIFLHKIVEGPADKSYGIQVGRLAGLPPTVITRAKDILALLEKEQMDSGIKPGQYEPDHADLQSQEKSAEITALLETLDQIKPDSLTPLEALQKIYDLHALVISIKK